MRQETAPLSSSLLHPSPIAATPATIPPSFEIRLLCFFAVVCNTTLPFLSHLHSTTYIHTIMATSGAGNPPVQQQQQQQSSDETTTSPLHAAMKMADLVQSSLNNKTNNNSNNDNRDFRTTPGLVEGMATGVLTLVVLTPVRSLVVRTATANKLGMLPDLVVTTSQIMIAANVALYAGSLYGSWHYLQTFTKIPVEAVSPTVDGICRQSLDKFASFDVAAAKQSNNGTPASPSSSLSLWNPNAIVLAEFAQAMALCRQRSQQAADEADQPPETKMTWWK